MKLYAVYNQRCGHVAGVVNDRKAAEAQMSMFGLTAADGWRLRANATDADLTALAEETRCEFCAFDEVPS